MPAEELFEQITFKLVSGTAVDPASTFRVVADNGAEIATAVTETVQGANGTAASITSLVDTSTSTTAGAGLLATELGTAGPAIAVGLGVLAGVGLYELAPEFWTNVSNALVNAGQTIGGKVISFLDSDGKQSYSVETINIIKDALIEAGIYDGDYIIPDYQSSGRVTIESKLNPLNMLDYVISKTSCGYNFENNTYETIKNFITEELNYNAVFMIIIKWGDVEFSGSSPLTIQSFRNHNIGDSITLGNILTMNRLTTSGRKQIGEPAIIRDVEIMYDGRGVAYVGETQNSQNFYMSSINASVEMPYVQPGAVVPSSSDSVTTTYPNWNPDTKAGIVTLPVEYPYNATDQQAVQNPEPVSDFDKWEEYVYPVLPIPEPGIPSDPVNPQPEPEPDPDPQPDPTPVPTPGDTPSTPDPPNPNPEPEPDPTPVVITPPDTFPSSALFTVYNPTNAQLDKLGAFLWSSSIIEQIQKIWQDPLEGIISLRKVYATPQVGSSQSIILGNINTNIQSPVVTTQFQTLDCGSVTINEEKLNATDYSPYSSVHIYLPFIGIVELDTDEVMNATLHIVYGIDYYTGTCLAQIFASRNPDINPEKIIYQFSGNCSQEIPLTASTAMGLANALVSLGASAVAIASGGTLGMAAAVGTMGHSLSHELVHVGHSGSLSSNAGIMGQKKPYVIIGRRHQYDANGYNALWGYPTNKNVNLNNCSGYTRIKAINLRTAATQEEKDEIERLLKEGVIF